MEKYANLNSLAQEWLAQKKPLIKPASYAIYQSHLQTHILPAFQDVKDLTEDHVQEFVLYLLNKKCLSTKSVKDILMVLRMLAKFAANTGVMPFQKWDIHFPAWQRADAPQVLSPRSTQALSRYCREHFSCRNLGILLGIFTGLRIGEICALRWADYNRVDGTLQVRSTVGLDYNGRPIVGTPKTPSSVRTVPLPTGIKTYMAQLARMTDGGMYIVSGSTKPLAPRLLRGHFRTVCRRAGIADMRFHALRHSFATRCIDAGCDVKTVSALLGHSSVSTTLELYVHPTLAQKRRAVDRAAKLINFK